MPQWSVCVTATYPDFRTSKDCRFGRIPQNCLGNNFCHYNDNNNNNITHSKYSLKTLTTFESWGSPLRPKWTLSTNKMFQISIIRSHQIFWAFFVTHISLSFILHIYIYIYTYIQCNSCTDNVHNCNTLQVTARSPCRGRPAQVRQQRGMGNCHVYAFTVAHDEIVLCQGMQMTTENKDAAEWKVEEAK